MEAAYRGSYDSLRGIEAPRSEGALRLLLAVDEPGDRMPGTEMADVLSERYPGEPARPAVVQLRARLSAA